MSENKWIYADTKKPISADTKCEYCKAQIKLKLIITDDLLNAIRFEGKLKDPDLLCSSCIMKEIEKYFGHSVFKLFEGDYTNEQKGENKNDREN